MKEPKRYFLGEKGLEEGDELGRLGVYLAADYDHLKAENERLREGMRGDYDLDAWLDWCKERDTLRKQVDEARELLADAVEWNWLDEDAPSRERIDAWLEATGNR